jgi:hypothetical protein
MDHVNIVAVKDDRFNSGCTTELLHRLPLIRVRGASAGAQHPLPGQPEPATTFRKRLLGS